VIPDPRDLDDLLGLRGRRVLITGAASDISLWTAVLLRRAGAAVVLTDRLDDQVVRAAAADCAGREGVAELALGDDVTVLGGVDIRSRNDADAAAVGKGLTSVATMVRRASEALGGPVQVLINIAGGQEPVPAAALTTEVFRRTVDRILIGTFHVIAEVFDQGMREHGGRILTVTADVDQGYPMMPAMGAARSALTSLHRALSVEWAPLGITCAVVAPGATDTPGLRRYPDPERVRQVGIDASNLGRLLHPREVAHLFMMLASPWAESVNGQVVVANGGDSNVTPLYREMVRSVRERS
jgi:NAD(P)-dependent dehydrogenase (short-subunit alcohol dehydrogenase family)